MGARGEGSGGCEDGNALNRSQIMPFHINGNREHLSENLSKEQKCMRSASLLLSDDTFQSGLVSFRGKRLPIKCALYCEKDTQPQRVFLRYCLLGCARLLLSGAKSISHPSKLKTPLFSPSWETVASEREHRKGKAAGIV